MFVVPSLQGGGMEKVVAKLSSSISELDNYKVVLLILSKRDRFYDINTKVKLIEPNFTCINGRTFYTILHSMFYIRRNVKRLKPEVIISFGETYNAFIIFSCMFLKKNIFVSNRASPLSSMNGFRGLLNPFFYHFAKGVIVQTNKAKEILSSKYQGSKFLVIPNPFKIPSMPSFKHRENIILNIGRIGGEKNQELLIEYFSRISNWANWKLYFVGDGPNIELCKQKAIAFGVATNVVFAGKKKNIEDYYSKAKIFAFTSTKEGFPNALGEAMAFGLACISFDCIAGPGELINDGINGFLVKLGDNETYLKRLNQLIENESLMKELGVSARESMKKFSIDKIVNRYLETVLDPITANESFTN